MKAFPPVCLLLLLTKEVLNNKLSRGRDAAAFDDIIIIINTLSSAAPCIDTPPLQTLNAYGRINPPTMHSTPATGTRNRNSF